MEHAEEQIIIIIIIIIIMNVKTRVIPVIVGSTGTISQSFRRYESTIPGNHDVRELQKTATLDTANILRKVLM
jgi:branched-subunit amino acid transport protein AzlD